MDGGDAESAVCWMCLVSEETEEGDLVAVRKVRGGRRGAHFVKAGKSVKVPCGLAG